MILACATTRLEEPVSERLSSRVCSLSCAAFLQTPVQPKTSGIPAARFDRTQPSRRGSELVAISKKVVTVLAPAPAGLYSSH
jgi:hypothetical protein